MKYKNIIAFTLAGLATFKLSGQPKELESYNIKWNKQSLNSSESMPCGGGDIGLNVWVGFKNIFSLRGLVLVLFCFKYLLIVAGIHDIPEDGAIRPRAELRLLLDIARLHHNVMFLPFLCVFWFCLKRK